MVFCREARFRATGVAALLGAVLIVAGCGSSGGSSPSTSSSAPAATSSVKAAAATGISIRTAKGADGTYLIGPSGRALYLWVADGSGQSACAGACAKAWPPLTTSGMPSATGGVSQAELGTIARADGATQVTYKGHPLYYFIADSAPGVIKGQGSNSFGAKWWLVAPSGAAITAGGSAAAASTQSSSSGGSSSGSHAWG